MRDRRLKRGESMTMRHRPHSSLGDLTPNEFIEQVTQTGLQEAPNFQLSVV